MIKGLRTVTQTVNSLIPCLLFLFFSSSSAFATTELLTVSELTKNVALGHYIEIFEDPTAEMEFEEVSAPGVRDQFKSPGVDVPNLGFSSSAVWVRIQIRSDDDNSSHWFLEVDYPPLDEIALYFNDGNKIHKRVSGDMFPFKQRDIHYHNVVFDLELLSRERYDIYLRVKTTGSLQIPLTLWQPKAFTEKVNNENYLFGIYCGIMFVVIFYNLFLYFSVRDYSYLHYVIYVLFFAVVQMVLFGFAYEHFWPESPWLANHSLVICLAGTMFGIALFSSSFLHMKTYSPISHKIFVGLSIVSLLLMVAAAFMPYKLSILINAGLAAIVTPLPIITGFICLRAGYRPARFYLVAWGFLLFGSLAFILKSFGMLPTNVVTTYGPQIGSAIEVILLSLALGDRINYERREKYRAKMESMSNLEKADRLKDEFMATISHELRTPLNGMACSIALMKGADEKGETVSDWLKDAEMSTFAMQEIIEDILTFTEAKNERLAVNEEPFSLLESLKHLIQYYEEKCNLKGIGFIVDDEANIDRQLVGDHKKLTKILSHLIDNAVKFTEQGAVTLHINAGAMEEDQLQVIFAVEDTGKGIPSEKQQMVFDAFSQVDGSFTRNYGGLGIGLAICLAFVRALEGDIKLTSRNGNTCFEVTLSFKTAKEALKLKGQSEAKIDSLNVLIVEDNPVNLKLLSKMITKMGNHVVSAEDGEKGLEKYKSGEFDIVLMDCQMPVMDGYEATQEIRKIDPNIPIVAVTANALEKDRRHCFEVGMNDFIAKPINIKELKKVIYQWCQ